MKKYLLSVIMCLMFLEIVGDFSISQSPPVQEMINQSVTVIKLSDDQILGHGSGVFLNQSEVLTCFHVIDGGNNIKIIDCFGNAHECLKFRVDESLDLAILIIDPNTVSESIGQIEFGSVGVGDVVFSVGSPYTFDLGGTLTKGIVSGFRVLEIHMIQHDSAINPGNSGGPLYNENGQLVGINRMLISGFMPQWCGISLAIETQVIKTFYENYQHGEYDPKTLEQIADELWEKWNDTGP